jgi:transposase-like protein
MINRLKTEQEKEAIIAEYLLGETTYRSLEKKHGIDFRVIHSWVTKFKGKTVGNQKKPKASTEPLPVDIKKLQEELRKAKLHNELLNAIIDIAEEQLKINIRKKSGTKR